MEEIVYLTELYEYYKNLLTNKQRDTFEDYYFDNLTMEEIAENNNISKNAVSKLIIEIKKKLEEYENKLKLYENKKKICDILSEREISLIEKYI